MEHLDFKTELWQRLAAKFRAQGIPQQEIQARIEQLLSRQIDFRFDMDEILSADSPGMGM